MAKKTREEGDGAGGKEIRWRFGVPMQGRTGRRGPRRGAKVGALHGVSLKAKGGGRERIRRRVSRKIGTDVAGRVISGKDPFVGPRQPSRGPDRGVGMRQLEQ